ncbi:MAG: YoaK family protein [Alcanivoracaceae bacterium]
MIHTGDDVIERPGRVWVFVAGGLLAAIAGYVNVVMLGFFAVPVSHMTGAVSRLSMDLAIVDLVDLMLIAGIVAGFLLGALLSGIWIGAATLRAGRRYGAVLMVQGIMLAVATWMALEGIALAVPVAAFVCGLQNAMASSYRGLVLRTTHVTGIVTDIGVLIGQRMRHKQIRIWKLLLLLTLLLSFFSGGLLGAVLYHQLGMLALSFAAVVCFVTGTGYAVVQHQRNN